MKIVRMSFKALFLISYALIKTILLRKRYSSSTIQAMAQSATDKVFGIRTYNFCETSKRISEICIGLD